MADLRNKYGLTKYIPIVVFTSNADFKKLNVTSYVVYSVRLNGTIKHYTEENIALNDISKIVNIILTANTDDKSARKQHVTRIQESS